MEHVVVIADDSQYRDSSETIKGGDVLGLQESPSRARLVSGSAENLKFAETPTTSYT